MSLRRSQRQVLLDDVRQRSGDRIGLLLGGLLARRPPGLLGGVEGDPIALAAGGGGAAARRGEP